MAGPLVVLQWIAAVGLGVVVVTLRLPARRRLSGPAERVCLLSTNLWFLVAALMPVRWAW
ncbi:hypothetical protein [Actinoplanes teichomyceticus]|uniref:Uncharacterized protein n=1 Tax=Actinoplanes teichomyceticus TaxID=1867 RepID=A0A561WK15_ACTTI|nr:hypothetical protein [Actinoplanes teichomyceticus]TWG24160.1 hypothetical protein FHX34_102713 [Actinoplanes teichomyceticus]GIF12996.1 hypothetical protein Ate01nite_30280 [Actinoplanes teichomyceticus]